MHQNFQTPNDLPLREIEDLGFRVVGVDHGAVVLTSTLTFDLHVRPATFLYGRLCEHLSFDRLRLRRGTRGEWSDFQPLSLVALALSRGELIEIQVKEPFTKDCLLNLARAFRDCPLYREYDADADGDPGGDDDSFRSDFESEDGALSLIKLNIENFVLGHVAEIEAYILKRSLEQLTDHAELRLHFKRLLLDIFANFGMISLDLPLDNLLQTRDMCYHLHFAQIERAEQIPYSVMGLEWGQESGSAWRRNQTRRHCYYYEQESDFYCDLFLVMVLREESRLRRFVSTWRERLDYSLRLRHDLPAQLKRIEHEMESFSPNFENPKEFFNHLRLMGEMVIEDVSRLTPFMELLREERIYHPTLIGPAGGWPDTGASR